MGKLTQIKRTEMLKRGKTLWGFWSDLFYKCSFIFYYIPSWLFCMVQKCTAVRLGLPGEWVLSSCITFMPPFHSWFLRSEHVLMVWEMLVACQITHQLCERRSIIGIDRGGGLHTLRAWQCPKHCLSFVLKKLFHNLPWGFHGSITICFLPLLLWMHAPLTFFLPPLLFILRVNIGTEWV